LLQWGNAKSAGEIVLSALRAEAVKLGLAVLLLWIVLGELQPGGRRRPDRSLRRHIADLCHGFFLCAITDAR